MTPTDLKLKFKFETGLEAIDHINPKNRHKYLSEDYVEWLEGKNTKMRDQFRKETGNYAMWVEDNTWNTEIVYKDTYKLWLEERKLELYNVIETLRAR
jgi:hypothetical protein